MPPNSLLALALQRGLALAKALEAFRNIGEVSVELGIKKHVLRFWELKFPQLKPMKRGGGRRLYRPTDVRASARHPRSPAGRRLHHQGRAAAAARARRRAHQVGQGRRGERSRGERPRPRPASAAARVSAGGRQGQAGAVQRPGGGRTPHRHGRARGLPQPARRQPCRQGRPAPRALGGLASALQRTAAAAARPAVRPEKMQPPRKVPSSAR